METFQEFIDKFSGKRSSNTWKHSPAKSWDILKFERFSSFMGSKNLKPCTRQKLWRWNCLQFLKLTKLKLIPSQSWGTPKAESFSNWDLHKLKQFKGLKIHPYWMLRRRTQEFFPILEIQTVICSFPNVETLYKLKSSPMKSFSKVNKFGRLKMHTCPKLSYAVSFQNQRKTSEHVTVYPCHYLSKSETSETNFSSSLFLNVWCS